MVISLPWACRRGAHPAILNALRTPADALADAIAYLRVIFAAMPFMYFFNFMMMAQRGMGDARTPFYFALLQVGLDITFNPILIMGFGPFPKMGIAGSAAATLICQTVTLAAMLVYLYRKHSILVLRPGELHELIPDMAIIRTLVFKGAPMGFQMIVISLAGVTMLSSVNRYGSPTAAAYGRPCSSGTMSRCRPWRWAPRSRPWPPRTSARAAWTGWTASPGWERPMPSS